MLTLPKIGEFDPNKRFRFALDVSVIWLFFFLAWSAFYLANQAQAEALGANAGPRRPKAPPRPRRSGRCATRSIRTSCSTRSIPCRR